MAKKRKDGRYQQGFTYKGKRYTVYATSRNDLNKKVAEKIQELSSSVDRHSNPTLVEYNKIYVDFKRNKIKSSTLRNYENWFNLVKSVKLPAGITLGEVLIAEIRPTDIIYVQKHLIDSGSSPRTVNGSLSHLSNIFKLAIKDGTIIKNPCDILENVKNTEKPARETKHRALSKTETEDFFKSAADSHYINAFKLMLQTGMRIGELGALTKDDIDYQENTLHISKTITRDENGHYIVSETPKTSTSTRRIPLNSAIKGIINEQKRINLKLYGGKAERLFLSPKGQLIREYSVNRDILRITKRAEMEKFTSHAFRATFATRFIEQRPQDYKVLSEILGHANIKITLDLYTHVMQETKKTAMDELIINM